MAQARPLPWLVLALGTGVLGWWIGRQGRPDALVLEAPPLARKDASAERGPTLEAAAPRTPTEPTPRGSGVQRTPPPAPPGPDGAPAPDGATPVPDGALPLVEAAILHGADRGRVVRFGGPAPPETDEQRAERERLESVEKLMQADPDAAARSLADLLRSGRPEDRRVAYRALGNARHPSHRTLAERALHTAREGDDIEGIQRMLARLKGRDWSPEQITGAPDTLRAGDLPTAWASRQPEMGLVWVEVDFPEAVSPERVRVHETLAPGAIAQVLAQDDRGDWVSVWVGEAEKAEAPHWFEVGVGLPGRTRSLRLIVDTDRVPGWNELDAVELIGDGRRQWAHAARAGSSYGE